MLYQYDIKQNVTKDHIDGSLRYRRSCLCLCCLKCSRNNSISHITFFEEHLEILAEGIFCPHCNNSFLPDSNFCNMVKEIFYAPYNLETYSSMTRSFPDEVLKKYKLHPKIRLTFNSLNNSVDVNILGSGEGWVINDSEIRKLQELYELDREQLQTISQGIKFFDFINWRFFICSQNSNVLTQSDQVEICELPHDED